MENITWKGCRQYILEITPDDSLITSLRETSFKSLQASKTLPFIDMFKEIKLCLLYDAIREYLESFTISKGFKITNHICYVAYLQTISKRHDLGIQFDEFRKLRNLISYSGESYDMSFCEDVYSEMLSFYESIKILS